MHPITKAFVSGAAGSFVASFAEPKIAPHLPASLQTPNVAKVTHAVVAGCSTALCYWALGFVVKS